jgi:hypothetical protein
MPKDEKSQDLSPEELEQENGEELPDREAMSVVSYPGDPGGGTYTLPVEPPEEA